MIPKKQYTYLAASGALLLAPACFTISSSKEHEPITMINSSADLIKLFPTTPAQLQQQIQETIEHAHHDVQNIVMVKERTFANTARALDQAKTNFAQIQAIAEITFLLHPDSSMRKAGQEAQVTLEQAKVDIFDQNSKLYTAFTEYVENNASTENLTKQQRYFLDETMQEFKRSGLSLPLEQQEKVKELTKKIAELCATFESNIHEDKSSITATQQELAGLDPDFISSLKQDATGMYILGTDRPTYNRIMDTAQNSQLRKRMYHAYCNRAYPQNYDVLNALIGMRDLLAQTLGYKSFAHLNIESGMAKTPENVQAFLESLLKKAKEKASGEIKALIASLPPDVPLSPEGKIYPWDYRFIFNMYKKNYFNLDEEQVSSYFPMEHTIEQLLEIYQRFFNITFTEEPIQGLWHPEVKLITVFHKNGTLIGYLLLDLYPREGKYSHAAQSTVIYAQQLLDGKLKPAVGVIMANFPKSLPNKPSLLKRDDVSTFFHEFGHGLHALLGATSLGTQSGTSVKVDFVEMPSQMLEEWLWDKEILKMISKHYQTGESLPDTTLDTMIRLKNINSGSTVMTQGIYAELALAYFQAGPSKDLDGILQALYNQHMPLMEFYKENHFPATFGHLTLYGSRYYSYLWSKVFALDLFDTIRKEGLLNPAIGTVYAEKILAQGGSADPEQLLENFLGRKPNDAAFLRDLGLQTH